VIPENARSILHAGRQAHVGVTTKNAPHVTPVLYAPTENGIAFPTAASTLKGRKVREGQGVGVAVRWQSRAVLFRGEAYVVDPFDIASIARRVPDIAKATASFAARNGVDLAGFAKDALGGRLPLKRLDRRLFVFVTAGDVMVLEDLPSEGGVDAMIAAGDIVLPGRWDADTSTATVPTEALQGWAGGPAAVVLDEYVRPGPAAKTGLLLRGSATVEQSDDGRLSMLKLDTEKIAAWADAETASVQVDG
jgi:hypothetical protein